MELEKVTIQRLKAFAKNKGIKVTPTMRKSEVVQLLQDAGYYDISDEIDIYRDEDNKVQVVEETLHIGEVKVELSPQVAIYVSKRLAVTGVGIFDPGYHIVDRTNLPLFMVSSRVRVVSPEELLKVYES